MQPPGVRPLGDYALIIDARTPKEFDEDHIPGATNLPIVTQQEFAEVGTLHRTDPHAAYVIGAQYALRNVARHIGETIAPLPRRSRLLIYCFRGGKRSRAWADPLLNIGFQVDVLPGGWKAYRAWVREQLECLPERLSWHVLAGTTASGKTRLLQALREAGAQVLDLEALACHRGSLLGALPGRAQPVQKRFDSALLQQLLDFDPARPVWVEDESKKVGKLQLPAPLHVALQGAKAWQLEAPMAARVQACREDYAHFAADPLSMVALLQSLKPLVGGEALAQWQALAEAGEVDALFEALMRQHYDPCYRRWLRSERRMRSLPLPDLHPSTLVQVARRLMQPDAA
ncbi:MAG: tRNA 2-selenouridine(34) synthase MnmH [Burkholderiales bacterium]|nr:tRNA 2-selenouridine(34) synthase MnmH [Burkholderiales bacterium]